MAKKKAAKKKAAPKKKAAKKKTAKKKKPVSVRLPCRNERSGGSSNVLGAPGLARRGGKETTREKRPVLAIGRFCFASLRLTA